MPFPDNDLEVTQTVMSLLGSFWNDIYADKDFVAALVAAKAELELQNSRDLEQLAESLALDRVPSLSRKRWQRIVLLNSQKNVETDFIAYGDPHVYGDGTSYAEQTTPFGFSFPIPPGLQQAPILFDKTARATMTLVAGVDYVLDPKRQLIVFKNDPFVSPNATIVSLTTGGTLSDQELELWACEAAFDRELLYWNFGFPVGVRLPSSEEYRTLIHAITKAWRNGTTVRQIDRLISVACDIPLSKHPTETVQAIRTDNRHLCIITDQDVYLANPSANPIVTVGQVILEGTSLTDALTINEFQAGSVPEDLLRLTIGPGILGNGFYQDLTFENATVPLQVSTDTHGKTVVTWEVLGFPNDVEKFWDDVHTTGLAQGRTLAQTLDIRSNPVEEPGPASLPPTVNPLQFLIQHFLRGNAFLVRIRVNAMGSRALGLPQLRLLRKILPPQTVAIFLFEIVMPSEMQAISQTPGPNALGYTESLGTGLVALEATETYVSSASATETIRLQPLGGRCL